MIEHCNVACDSSTYMLESPISNLWQSICVVALTTLVCRGKSLGLSKELTMSEETILVDSNILYCHLSMSCGFQIHIFTSCLPSNTKGIAHMTYVRNLSLLMGEISSRGQGRSQLIGLTHEGQSGRLANYKV